MTCFDTSFEDQLDQRYTQSFKALKAGFKALKATIRVAVPKGDGRKAAFRLLDSAFFLCEEDLFAVDFDFAVEVVGEIYGPEAAAAAKAAMTPETVDVWADAVPPEIADRYKGRLAFDTSISAVSPIIKGTWITVDHVLERVSDGFTWSEILRAHPELTEDDLRTCLSYAVTEDIER